MFWKGAALALAGLIVGSGATIVYTRAASGTIVASPMSSPATSAPQTSSATDDQALIVAAVRRDEPSVVALDVTVNGRRFIPANPFAPFLGEPEVGQLQPYQEQASGSGFVVSRDGLIVTNAHVVEFGRGTSVKVTVVFADGHRDAADVYAASPSSDIALVKVEHDAKLPPPLPLGHSDRVQAGEWAIAIGEPFALQQSVSVGVVSGFNRSETIADNGTPRQFKGLLQTSAPINPGNSGGPLLDDHGLVIGVNQSVASPAAGAEGIGFAIPVDTVRQQVASLEQHPGELNGPPTPYLGVSLTTVDSGVAAQLNYLGKGAVIENVFNGGPADKAGLQPGDVIQAVNGKRVTTADQVVAAIQAAKPGSILTLRLWSQGSAKVVRVRLGTAPAGFPSG